MEILLQKLFYVLLLLGQTLWTARSYKPKVFCMVFTTYDNWKNKGLAVKYTWARRCDDYRFFYSAAPQYTIEDNKAYPLDVPEGRDHLTAKTMNAFRLAYQNYTSKFDWYMKADDDTYIIMENLKHLLSQLDANKPFYVGGRSMTILKNGYNGGGASYLLSKVSVQKLLNEAAKSPKNCKPDGAMEDLDIGHCLQYLDIYPVNTRDDKDRMTFHPDHPLKLFSGQGDARQVYWYRRDEDNLLFGNPNRDRMLSEHTISLHYVEPHYMYMYDFLLYELQRHGS